MNKIKAIILDVYNQTIDVSMIENSLDEFYKIIRCSCITIATRTIEGRVYDFIVDDNGLFTRKPILCGLSTCFSEDRLYGTVIITKSNRDGETISLDDDDIFRIKRNIKSLFCFDEGVCLVVVYD